MTRLPYRAPFDWPAMLTFLADRAIDGVEVVGETYRRTAGSGWVEVSHDPARQELCLACHGDVGDAAMRVRRVFDLDADVAVIERHLARDPFMARVVARQPGLRAPGAWDGFELAIRAVLGQQITVGAARGLGGRIAALCGNPSAAPGLSRVFPDAASMARTDLSTIGMPAARRATLRGLADAALDDPGLFAPPLLPGHAARLLALPGVGDWTAQYVLLRAVRDADAFPASDVGLLRAATAGGVRPTADQLRRQAEAWRPYRAYAAQHLWASLATGPG